MSYQLLGQAIKEVVQFINTRNLNYALIGGLAVSFRTIERATKDIDFAIAVSADSEAEIIVRDFQQLSFKPDQLMENKKTKSISTVRLLSSRYPNVYLDLLFSVTGIEKEITDSAEMISLLKGVEVKIATLSSLIAMKILSSTSPNRRQDLVDLQNLILEASESELSEAKHLVKLIQNRGFDGGKDLISYCENFIREVKNP